MENPEEQFGSSRLLSSLPSSTGRGFVHFYAGGVNNYLKQLESTVKFNLIFADPPFNNGSNYDDWNDKLDWNVYDDWTRQWILNAISHLSDDGSLWINVPDSLVSRIDLLCTNQVNLIRQNWCIWHYRFGQNNPNRFTSSKTHVLWYSKSKNPKFYPERILVPSDRQTIYNDSRAEHDGRLPFDVWGFEKYWGRVQGNNRERSPANVNQLPEEYAKRILLSCTDEHDLIYDPFCGSGTFSTVGRALNRHCNTTDVSESYLWLALMRANFGMVER